MKDMDRLPKLNRRELVQANRGFGQVLDPLDRKGWPSWSTTVFPLSQESEQMGTLSCTRGGKIAFDEEGFPRFEWLINRKGAGKG